MKKLSILIADDSPQVCSLLATWLRFHSTACVHTGADALSALSLLHFDLIISDILMPNIDGLEVIKSLRTTQPWVKILAISGGGRFANASDCTSKAKEAGADEVLLKPFDEDQLKRKIDAITSISEPEFMVLPQIRTVYGSIRVELNFLGLGEGQKPCCQCLS